MLKYVLQDLTRGSDLRVALRSYLWLSIKMYKMVKDICFAKTSLQVP